MGDVMERINHWRMKAEELRTTADHVENPFARASFRRLAETYDRLAADFSQQTSSNSSSSSRAG
jgi:hypothetical protein